MSNTRTLLRRHKLARMVRNDKNELVLQQRIAPGTPRRRILSTSTVGPFELSYHATKGPRCVRLPA